ncbi:MAG: enoyl-CoA hydratase/isomerase family protein [Alphaproteobacteria bacterium]
MNDHSTDEVKFSRMGGIGLITMTRPRALNSLTLDMCLRMRAQMRDWAEDDTVGAVVIEGEGEKGFCAGGDIRALHDSGREGTPYALEFYANEYRLNNLIAHYPKPYVALMDGITMGGGVGVSVHGSHRVLTDRTVFAMPETGIGLIPDVGGSYFLPRLPDEAGMFLGLTGERIKAGDALDLVIGTHYVPGDVEAVKADLAKADFGGDPHKAVSSVLDAHAGLAPGAKLRTHRPAILKHFSGESVEAILDSLKKDGSEWALGLAEIMRTKSPTSMKITFRQIREGAELGVSDCLRLEFRLVSRIMEAHDFYEGVRAVIIEKDNKPDWNPATLEEVSDAEIESYFAPLGPRELDLEAG